jgi:probable HAF family extracellular repeat protein
MNTLNYSRKPAAVRRAGGCLFLLAGFHFTYMHRTMRAVVCALWVLTTASCAHAAASLTQLAWLPGDNFNYNTIGVSADGSVVVGTSGFEPYEGGDTYRAFRWTAGSGMVSLGVSHNSFASGVSGDGSVIVGNNFRWTAGTGMVGLGYLPGATNSSANGVSADGSVIVGTSGSQAFRWTAGSGMVGLGYLPGGNSSSATAVRGDGSIVVGNGGYGEAFRWTAGSGMQNLRDVLVMNGLNLDPAFWLTASGISADGNTIVGSHLYSDSDFGVLYGYVATLPGLIGVSPVLSINSWSSAAHHLVLSWSTNYTGCTLQSSTGLGSTNWTDCASPTVSGASFVVTNSMSAGAQFFRLKR